MQWGSQWAIATHSGVNPLCLCCCDDTRNSGGSLKSRQGKSESATRSADGVNPLLRVKPPGTNEATRSSSTSQPSLPQRELIYATDAFDGQRGSKDSKADSRWRGIEYRRVRVPKLDTLLLVAFQKLLRDEELEFLLLLLAMECE